MTFSCTTPIDGSTLLTREHADRTGIESALNCARKAQDTWKRTPLADRQDICLKAMDILSARKETLALEICRQMGRPVRFAQGEIKGMIQRGTTMTALARKALAPITLEPRPGIERWIQRDPLGTVLIISPWNYPYLTAINALVPALLAGNTVLLKHSAQTPLCAERLTEAFGQAGCPEGVFQYLHLTHPDTEALIADPRINYVAFTGSVPGGKMVEKNAAGRFIGTGLELGGKDPAYVRADASLSHAAETVMDGAFFNSGQSCCAIERVYVHQKVFRPFLDLALAWVKAQKLGRPDDPDTTLGPLVRESAALFVREQIQEAVSQGAEAHILPEDFPMDKKGSPYLAPQVLTNVDHTMRVMTEESFGPVIGIQEVASDEEALALMNDSEFGLTASIFTRDAAKGIELGQQVETGTFFVNRCDYLDPELAWTGIKNSGRGCTLSLVGFEALTRPKSFYIKKID